MKNPFPVFLFAAWLLGASFASGEEPRILFIGNSYTGQIRSAVTKLMQASPHSESELKFIAPGGKNLQWHLDKPETVEEIKKGNWDYVVLQDQSQTPAVFPDRFAKAAAGLNAIIRESGARTVFYMTWGRRDGDKQNIEKFPDYDTMQKALSRAYESSARKTDSKLAPVGLVWAEIRKQNPKLGVSLYKNDGSHPSAAGAYLAACVFYATLFGENPGLAEFEGGLPPADAKLIRETAWNVVEAKANSNQKIK